MTPRELADEEENMGTIARLLQVLLLIPPRTPAWALFCIVTLISMLEAVDRRAYFYSLIDPVNPYNKDRRINTFSEGECWRMFRFRADDLQKLCVKLGL